MHDDVETTQDLDSLLGNEVRAFGRGKIRPDQPRRSRAVLMACGHDNVRLLRGE